MSGLLEGLVETKEEAEQPALFGALGGPESGVSGGNPPPAERSGPGRRRGSRNRATEQLREFYLGRYPDPLEGAIAWSLPADLLEGVRRALALAKLLRCKPLEALEFLRKSGEGAMPYLHARAMQLKVDSRHVEMRIGVGMPARGRETPGGLAGLRAMLEAARDELAPDEREAIEALAADVSPETGEVESDDNSST